MHTCNKRLGAPRGITGAPLLVDQVLHSLEAGLYFQTYFRKRSTKEFVQSTANRYIYKLEVFYHTHLSLSTNPMSKITVSVPNDSITAIRIVLESPSPSLLPENYKFSIKHTNSGRFIKCQAREYGFTPLENCREGVDLQSIIPGVHWSTVWRFYTLPHKYCGESVNITKEKSSYIGSFFFNPFRIM